jgi:phosphoglycolate phosphatase-like HAD superfamily hydrolase
MIKAIIFDVDGVLIDSVKIVVEAYQKTAKKLGLMIPSSQEILDLLGKPLEEITRFLWPKTDYKLFIDEYRKLFLDKNLVIPRIDGATDTVKKIKNSGFKLGIISGKPMFFVKKHLEESGFDLGWFNTIVSFETTKNHKPDPEPIFYVINKLNVKSEETLYVGDAEFDYECAKNAGVEFIAVLTGSLKRDELEMLGVKNIINSVSDLLEFLGLK